MDEVHHHLPEPSFVAADRRHVRRDVDHEPEPLPLGEDPQPLGAVRRDPSQVDVVEQDEGPTALDPGEVEQLVDHLDEVPGLDLDLHHPLAHLRRHGVPRELGVPGERLREQAHRRQRSPQLVRQVVDELGPDLLEAAELRDVLENDPETVRWGAPGPHDEDRPSGPLSRNSPDAPPP